MPSYRYQHTARAEVRRAITCAHCRSTADVTFEAVGTTGWIADHAHTEGTVERETSAALSTDVRRALALVRCPICAHRTPWAMRWAVARVAVWFAAAPILPIVAPSPLEVLWAIPVGLVMAGLTQLFRERGRAGRVRAARVVPLQVRTPPARLARRPAAALPAARAITAPPVTPTAAPPAPAPAAPSPPAGPSDEPTFLRPDR